jgi:hypothetical protein
LKRIPTFILALSFSAQLPSQAKLPPKDTLTEAPQITGKILIKKGVPFVYLWGSNQSRGFAEGFLRADAILTSFRSWVLSRIKPPAWDLVVVPTAMKRFHFPKHFRIRSKAIIQGMKRSGKIFVPELKRELQPKDLFAVTALIDAKGILCSSFAAWGKKVEGGGPIVCRNLDYSASAKMLKKQCIFVQAPYEGRQGTISVGWSSAWLVTGISDKGVFLAIHDVNAKAIRGRTNTPRMIALWELLERLGPDKNTWSGAQKILGSFDFAFGGNAMLAFSGPNPGAGVLEFGPRKKNQNSVTIRRSSNGNWIACTNHWRSRRHGKGNWRYRALEKKASQFDHKTKRLGREDIWKITSAARVKGTLHTILVDFGKGLIDLDLRVIPRQDNWVSFRKLSIQNLFASLPQKLTGSR